MAHFVGLPGAGEEQSEFVEGNGHLLRHGSSLALQALVAGALNESEEFGDVDPTEDWQNWRERRPDFALYYAALVDPARDGPAAVACVLRAVLDPRPAAGAPATRKSRLVVDYVTTRPSARGRGLASFLVAAVVEATAAQSGNAYVLALEDSCVYWMGRGFVLEASARLNARLNIFSDTHLLRRADDALDDGEPGDEDLAVSEDEDDSDDDDDDDDDGGDGESDDDAAEDVRGGLGDLLARATLDASVATLAKSAEPARSGARDLLLKAMANLQADPANAKYRKLRLTNATVAARIVAVPGARDVLRCGGFDHAEGDSVFVAEVEDSEVRRRARLAADALKRALPQG